MSSIERDDTEAFKENSEKLKESSEKDLEVIDKASGKVLIH